MARRNSVRKRLAAHAANVTAERELKERKAQRLERKVLRAATDDLALALSSTVALQPTAPAPGTDEDMVGSRGRTGRARKRNAARKKAAERLRKIAARAEARKGRDVDVDMSVMEPPEEDEEEVLDEVEVVGGTDRLRGRAGRSLGGVRKARPLSHTKVKRMERKERAKKLMRETMIASVEEGDVGKRREE